MDGIPEVTKFLLEQGFLGITVLVLLLVIRQLFKLYRDGQDARLTDYKELMKEQTDTLKSLESAINTLTTYIRGGLEK